MIVFAIISIILLVYACLVRAKVGLYKIEQDLEDWISFGTGDDIVRCKGQRPEYQHYVVKAQNIAPDSNIPKLVIKLIREDLRTKDLFKVVYLKMLYYVLKGRI